jgi:hypothetical protein
LQPETSPKALLEQLAAASLPGQTDVNIVHSLYMHLYSEPRDWVDAFFQADGLAVLNQLLTGSLQPAEPGA